MGGYSDQLGLSYRLQVLLLILLPATRAVVNFATGRDVTIIGLLASFAGVVLGLSIYNVVVYTRYRIDAYFDAD